MFAAGIKKESVLLLKAVKVLRVQNKKDAEELLKKIVSVRSAARDQTRDTIAAKYAEWQKAVNGKKEFESEIVEAEAILKNKISEFVSGKTTDVKPEESPKSKRKAVSVKAD